MAKFMGKKLSPKAGELDKLLEKGNPKKAKEQEREMFNKLIKTQMKAAESALKAKNSNKLTPAAKKVAKKAADDAIHAAKAKKVIAKMKVADRKQKAIDAEKKETRRQDEKDRADMKARIASVNKLAKDRKAVEAARRVAQRAALAAAARAKGSAARAKMLRQMKRQMKRQMHAGGSASPYGSGGQGHGASPYGGKGHPGAQGQGKPMVWDLGQ